MVKSVIQYRIFIATPSDIKEEREIISQIINEWNIQIGQHKNIHLEASGWDTHSYPEVGGRPQEIINNQVLEQSDILIGVFWTKFGTPTGIANSGTEEEIRKSIHDKKKVMVYFSDSPISPSKFDVEEYNKIKIFKEDFKDRGLYFSYTNTSDFREILRNHLAQVMNSLMSLSKNESSNIEEISIAFPTTYWTVILASIEFLRERQIPEIDKLREKGINPSELEEELVTALSAPYIIRSKLVDELYLAGAMTKEAVDELGTKKMNELFGLDKE